MNAPSAEDPNLQIARIVRVGEAVKEESEEPNGGLWTAARAPEKVLPPLRFKRRAATA